MNIERAEGEMGREWQSNGNKLCHIPMHYFLLLFIATVCQLMECTAVVIVYVNEVIWFSLYCT